MVPCQVSCRFDGASGALLDHRSGIQISPAQWLLNRRTIIILPVAASSLLIPGITDGEVTHTKLQLHKRQQAQYYNRGALVI